MEKNKYYPQSVPHPGETLAEKLEEMKMGPKEFAVRTVKPEKTITSILKGNSSITPDMAVQFENVTKIPAHFWMNHQRGYDEYKARLKRETVIEEAVKWVMQFPVDEMVRNGWLPDIRSNRDMAAEMLAFFGFASHKAWENYYLNQQLKVAFRISLRNIKEPFATSAWLRQGERQSADLKVNAFAEKKFRDALPEIKRLATNPPDLFFSRLQAICLNAGVKVVLTQCLTGTWMSGSARWLNDTPLIQLSGKYNKEDRLDFTFFHEAGHILLHGKKDIFLEGKEYPDQNIEKEKQADEFAEHWIA